MTADTALPVVMTPAMTVILLADGGDVRHLGDRGRS